MIGTLTGDVPVRRVIDAARCSFEKVRVVPVMESDEAFSPRASRNVVVLARNDARAFDPTQNWYQVVFAGESTPDAYEAS